MTKIKNENGDDRKKGKKRKKNEMKKVMNDVYP